uniref:Tyrosine-protein kinase family protein n=1 Tax=Eiseniibacteriota bacterium TaxID=2212470 RepID=A0A832I4G5_UNCEI
MSRILDALKKARGAAPPPAAVPPPTPVPAPVPAAFRPPGPAAAVRPAAPPPALAPWSLPTALPEDVQREMAALRVGLEAALGDRVPRVVAFHASVAGEGATSVARHFTLSLARGSEAPVLLVDAHAQRPTWTAARGAPPARDPEAARISVLPLAERHAAEGRILPGTLRDALDALAGGFEWIVVDGPPVLEAPDAPALAAAVDGVVLVVQAGRTKRPVLARSADILRKSGARILGTVLNRRRLEIPDFLYRRL